MEWLLGLGGAWLVWKLFLSDNGAPMGQGVRKLPQEPSTSHHASQAIIEVMPPPIVATSATAPIKTKPPKKLPQIELSDEARQALQALDDGKNVFISGAAGTGKSTFLKYLLACLEGEKNFVVLAPTGVAALNVGGQTIHSFFKFKPCTLTEDDIPTLHNKRPTRGLDLIIIDEISMVRADLFDSVNRYMKKNGRDPSLPFGGTQVLILGDLYQLPPVLKGEDEKFFSQLYDSPFFFHTNAYHNGGFVNVEFTKVYRQKDIDFVTMLNRIRIGDVDEALVRKVNSRVAKHFPQDEIQKLDPIVLTARNVTADAINNKKLRDLDENPKVFEGVITGKFDFKDNRLPAPLELTLKKGARVMFTKNDKMKRWVNGTLGQIVGLGTDKIMVAIGQSLHELEREKWENIRYVFNEDNDKWEQRVIGTYSQYPLMLAWAVTIHKSQGQTLDSCMVDLEGGAFAEGQTYVALSRCRTFEGLFLKQDINLSDIRVNAEVKHFMSMSITHR